MFTTRRGLVAPQNTFLDTVLKRCDGPNTCFLLANARILEFPIVYASSAFSKLFGFSRIEVLLKPASLPFLHGPQTNRDHISSIEVSLREQTAEHVELILYTKTLTAKWTYLRIIPIRNEQETVVLYLITFRDVSAFRLPVEDDFAASSALGAIAASSDSGSSWGRFARLVFSMVRQKEESVFEGLTGELKTCSESLPQQKELEKTCKFNTSLDDRRNPSDTTAMQGTNYQPSTLRTSGEPKMEDDCVSYTEIVVPVGKNPSMRVTHPERRSRSPGTCLSVLEEGAVQTRRNRTNKSKRSAKQLLASVVKSGKPVATTLLSEVSSVNSSQKRTCTSRHAGSNLDIEEYGTHNWLSPECAPRYRLEPPCSPKHVLLHYSAFRLIWDWAILLLTGYTAVVVPLRLAIIPRPTWVPLKGSQVWIDAWRRPTVPEAMAVADAVIDVIFCLDIVLNFHTSFVGSGGEVVAEPPVIRVNYLSGWFTLDLLSCLPYEIIKYVWPVNSQGVYSLLDGLRIARLLRIGRAARRVDQYLEYVSTLLLLMILCFFLLAHWFACAWYAVGVMDLESRVHYGWIPRYFNDCLSPQDWDEFVTVDYVNVNITLENQIKMANKARTAEGWEVDNSTPSSTEPIYASPLNLAFSEPHGITKRIPLLDAVDKWSAYITALYFSLSLLTTIGFGNVAAFTEAEKLLSICCMLIGALVYATIFGNITTIVQQLYATRTRYNEMMKGVKDFLRIHDVPAELGERVIDYITSSWSVNKGIDTAKVLNYCPKDMQADISVHLNRCVFNIHPAFRLASDGCRRSLAVHFQTLHIAPGDLIFHQGESVDQLCFVASGSLEVLQDDEVVALLGRGDVFGNPSWRTTNSVPSAASVRALTYCTLHTIRLERLRAVLQFYHAFSNSFARNLELNYNLCNRVVFRKLADVKRELELSMRNTKEPPLSTLPAEHPVRKLISRLRRSSQMDQSARRELGTIVSGDSSVVGSDLDSMSGSIQLEARKTSSLSDPRPGAMGRSTESEMHMQQQSVTILGTHNPNSAVNNNDTVNIITSSSTQITPNTVTVHPNPANKWARLLSKAAQPRISATPEEPPKESKEDPNKDACFTRESVETESIPRSAIPEVVNKEVSIVAQAIPGGADTTVSLMDFGITLKEELATMRMELKKGLTEVIRRIDHLETQVEEIGQQIIGKKI